MSLKYTVKKIRIFFASNFLFLSLTQIFMLIISHLMNTHFVTSSYILLQHLVKLSFNTTNTYHLLIRIIPRSSTIFHNSEFIQSFSLVVNAYYVLSTFSDPITGLTSPSIVRKELFGYNNMYYFRIILWLHNK